MAIFDYEAAKKDALRDRIMRGSGEDLRGLTVNMTEEGFPASLEGIEQRLSLETDPFSNTGYPEKDYTDPIARIMSGKGTGTLQQAMYQNFYGLNRFSGVPYAPLNRPGNGFVFFTRPSLNLSYDNLKQVRTFTTLANKNEKGVLRAIRAMLDPAGSFPANGYPSPMINPCNPFMPVLSNNLLTLSGWPELVVDTFTSDPGIYKEEWSIADGFARNFSAFEMTASFRNIYGDPISWIFHYWTQYMLYLHEGVMDPRVEQLINNEIDYDTRIYRLIMDKTFRYVEKIAAVGAAFPVSDNSAAQFDFDTNKPIGDGPDEISVTFKCMGADYNDPITIYEFNMAGERFDPRLSDRHRTNYYQLIKPAEAMLLNHRGIPRINVYTMELEWWILRSEYDRIIKTTGDSLDWITNSKSPANYQPDS